MDKRFQRLLHLSYDPVSKFDLRVPENRLSEEDSETKRICLAPSIEDAINAKPGGAAVVRIALERNIPLLLYVYEAIIPRESLILPINVCRQRGVRDAIHNQEYWATEIPKFQESVFVLDGVEFAQHPYFHETRIKSARVHKCEERPPFCAQTWAAAINKALSSSHPTDLLLMQLPGLEERLGGRELDAATLQESLPTISRKIKASSKFQLGRGLDLFAFVLRRQQHPYCRQRFRPIS